MGFVFVLFFSGGRGGGGGGRGLFYSVSPFLLLGGRVYVWLGGGGFS